LGIVYNGIVPIRENFSIVLVSRKVSLRIKPGGKSMKALLVIWNIVLTIALMVSFVFIFTLEDETEKQVMTNREAIKIITAKTNELVPFVNENREKIKELEDFTDIKLFK